MDLTIPEVIEGESSEEKAGWGWIGAYTDLLRWIIIKKWKWWFFNLSILSYEIVYQFGGIYIDTDSKSLKPFDSLFQHSFVCYDPGYNLLFHSIFGMPPKSKFLRFALESARLNFKNEEFRKQIVFMRYGPTFLSKMFFEFNDKIMHIIDSQYLVYDQKNNLTYMIQVQNCKMWFLIK